MVIGLDIDDTITETFDIMFAYGEKFMIEDLKREINIKNVNNVDDSTYIQTIHNWNEEEEKSFFLKYFKNVLEETIPYPFAVKTINKLKEAGHQIVLITARFDFMENSKLIVVSKFTTDWLNKYDIKYDKLITNVSNKGEVAKEHNVDIFVDDNFKQCLSVESKGIKTYIMNNNYNSACNHPNIKRVYSWPHLAQELGREII